jgi:hypothetical protein
MKNQKELEDYLESRGVAPSSYKILKERGSWYQDKSLVVLVAKNNTLNYYNLESRYWNKITTEKVDSLLSIYYTKGNPISVVEANYIKANIIPDEDFKDIK